MDKYVYGIDLGTTYSCIAYVDKTGRATVINNSEGTNTTPSVVNFASPKQVVVGQVAKDTSVIDPNNTVSMVKTLMGKSDFAINYNGENKSPEEVSNYLLKKLTADAAKQIDEEVKDVVITCPAYFGSPERTATKNAGIIAGLNVLGILSEPTAAAIYYGFTKEQEEKNILVYDLGGGTFDVTIMRISSDKIEVICSVGDHDLGGKDWDAAIIRYLADEFKSETGYDGDFDEYAQQELAMKAEKAKQQLTAKETVTVIVEAAGEKSRINFSRETFDEITSPLLNSTIDKTDAAIAESEGRGYKVDEILLVGGSTRMPQVTKVLVEKYGIEPKILEPDEAVAKGAAIHAVNFYSKPISATTKSFGIEAIVNSERKCRNIIFKNNPITDGAITVSQTFRTMGENMETMEINVYENDFMEEYFDIDENYKIGTAILELPGNLPDGAPIEVTFSLNNEGILEVTGKDITSNKTIKGTIQSKYIMTGESV
ncbi:MAG: Hsp70 family protein [ANME-2 cluster archaeon]|nr:Hsp70 family protein [ANME-2 cluster archaeon]